MNNTKLKILICEDDLIIRKAITQIVRNYGEFCEASNFEEAVGFLSNQEFDLALIDFHLNSDRTGLEVLAETKKRDITAIMLSSEKSDRVIESCYLGGCDHFLSKLKLRQNLESYLEKHIRNLEGKIKPNDSYLTVNEALKKQIDLFKKINLKNQTIFIQGETGVGKSHIGKLIHESNYPKDAPYIHLNCSQIPLNLIESELFGHKKGSFTGADQDKKGKLELADGGTLFLDEIACMPVLMQQKLLNALDCGEFYPVGSSKPVKTTFTLISATCDNIFQMISDNKFRKDLFFRICGFNLEIPPLRNRKEDIPLLIKHFIDRLDRKIVIKEDALERLEVYNWPGNIRELKKTIDLLSLKEKGIICVNSLPKQIIENTNQFVENDSLDLTSHFYQSAKKKGLKEYIKEIESLIIKSSLEENHGKITSVIKELGISTSAFYRIHEKA